MTDENDVKTVGDLIAALNELDPNTPLAEYVQVGWGGEQELGPVDYLNLQEIELAVVHNTDWHGMIHADKVTESDNVIDQRKYIIL